MKQSSPKQSAGTTASLSNLVERSPGDLKPWPGNPRTHNAKQLTKLKASIQKFGFTVPVLVDETGSILSGHGRVQAALELGLSAIPVRIISGLTEAQKRAYVIADNKLAQLSGWDNDLLKQEFQLLGESDLEIELTGFSTAEIDILFEDGSEPASSDPDDAMPEVLPPAAVSQPGDLWVLGNHRLLCGSALEAESYAPLMDGSQAQMVISDPPYNVPINGHVSGGGKVRHREFAMASGDMSAKSFTTFLNQAFMLAETASIKGAIHFYFMDWRHLREIQDAAQPVFGGPRQLCIWVKDNGGMGSFYRSQHELVLVFKKGDEPHINNFELGQHGRYRTNVWEYPGVNTFSGKGHELLALHPTVKPVSLVADAIRDCSHRKGIVLDPFAGSGTILMAAERAGRYARAIELDPLYVDVAVLRWQKLTGQEAKLASSGQSWSEVREERGVDTDSGDCDEL
jgi:DNA modification methylase